MSLLTNTWQNYTLTFSAAENGTAVGPVQLVFLAAGSSVELDDVSLDQTNSSTSNPTAFRDGVVSALATTESWNDSHDGGGRGVGLGSA
jgi:hypothetical protein